MKFVNESMEDRGEDDTNAGKESDAAEECVTAGEEFASAGLQRVDGSHAGEDHGSVHKRIEPGHSLQEMIARHAEAERNHDDGRTHAGAARQPAIKDAAREQRLLAVLEHKKQGRPEAVPVINGI